MLNNHLIPLSLIIISGKEAFDFLQGQLTCDIRMLTQENSLFGALCNNQGRVLANFRLLKVQENEFHLELPQSLSENILKVLQKYAQFSQVSLFLAPLNKTMDLLLAIRLLDPVILPQTSGMFTPHELNYHLSGHISFQKGCFKGQEVIARMHYRGKLKKHLCHVILNSFEEIEQAFQAGELVNYVQIDKYYETLLIQKIS